ncbi:MAG: hypothetical protein ACPGWR_29595 [Ardenticatenaceae bacterium]
MITASILTIAALVARYSRRHQVHEYQTAAVTESDGTPSLTEGGQEVPKSGSLGRVRLIRGLLKRLPLPAFRYRLGKQHKELEQLTGQFKQWMADGSWQQERRPELVEGASTSKSEAFYERLPESAESFKGWLERLDTQEAQQLSTQVTAFASDLNFDLAWLTERQLENQPQLKQALEEVVGLYCLAYFKATQVQDDLKGVVS